MVIDGTAYISDVFVAPQQTAEFGTLNVVTGAFTPLPTNPKLNSLANPGMAPDVDKHLMYFINSEDVPFLGTLKPDGSISFIGSTPSFYGDIAFDNVNDVLYAVNPFGQQPTLVTLSTQNAAQTVIGPLGISVGLDYDMEYDETTGTLYLNNGGTGNLYTLNKSTGAASLVGPNFPGARAGPIIDAIAFDRPTTFIPVPPAVWTGAITMAGLAAAGAVRRRRRA